MKKTHYVIEGESWMSIARAAKLLGTNAHGIRKLMGSGELEWRQSRANSRTFLVSQKQVLDRLRSIPLSLPAKKRGETKPAFEPVRRSRGEAWTVHHLRLTLSPAGEHKN